MGELHVRDEYRTNNLSKTAGGSSVTVVYDSGKRFVYDKVKDPKSYIKRFKDVDPKWGMIMEIWVNDDKFWIRGITSTHFKKM